MFRKLLAATLLVVVLQALLRRHPHTQLFTVSTGEVSAENEHRNLGLTPKKPVNIQNPLTGAKKQIHGRFLHITDLHPDEHYKEGSDISNSMCHGGKGEAGKYGDAILGCDSPLILVEHTLDWIKENLKDKIDFIVWTGDNMRHDNDRSCPRTEEKILEMNEKISNMMQERFGDLPIPSLGNNDVYPHNLFAVGPTLQTREFFKVWRSFVPQHQMHTFSRGVYFFQEVIPNRLAVLSINTLYLFQSNPLVDSCDRKKDPGYKLFLWLGYVLKEMRQRGMKVWLTGHVPPNAKNYDVSCLRKYVAWSHEYRDVIIGGLYGHMNMDHFIPLDSVQAYKSIASSLGETALAFEDSSSDSASDLSDTLENLYIRQGESPDFSISSSRFSVQGGVPNNKVSYMEMLRETIYGAIKGKRKSGPHGERYSVVHVTPSVVPTFNPGFRVWEYNITDLYEEESYHVQSWDSFLQKLDYLLEEDFGVFKDAGESRDKYPMFSPGSAQAESRGKKRDKSFPPKMPSDVALGPAYVPQLFTPERYVQYYLDLKSLNAGKKDFAYEIQYATDDKQYAMEVLTVSSWLNLGRKLGRKGKKFQKLWNTFLHNVFVASDYENLGYG